MWDPNEMLGQWEREDDVLSWRSLDTIRDAEADVHEIDPLDDALDRSSDDDELAEIIEHRQPAHTVSIRISPDTRHNARKGLDPRCLLAKTTTQQQGTSAEAARGKPIVRTRMEESVQNELPSTSEMIGIPEDRTPALRVPPPSKKVDDVYQHPIPLRDDDWSRMHAIEPAFEVRGGCDVSSNQARHFVADERRSSMTLGDLLEAKSRPPLPDIPAPVMPSVDDNAARIQEMRELRRQCEELAEKERNLQVVLARQLHQIESLSEQLAQKDARVQVQQLDISGLKEKANTLDRQVTTLQQSLRQKEQALDQSTQTLLQKSSEVATMENKVRSLQAANESFQEHAQKATEEKDKVHKDYLQVVYELGKLQKQMNASAKETVSIAEKDLLLREIDQLKFEKEQLISKVKEVEARKTLSLQSNSVADAQRMKELQTRVRELEDELTRTRSSRLSVPSSTVSAGSLPLRPTQQENAHSLFYPPPAPADVMRASTSTMNLSSFSAANQGMAPSLVHGIQSQAAERPMSLKDTMADRQFPAPTKQSAPPAAAPGTMSLASLGFTVANRRASGSVSIDHGAFEPASYVASSSNSGSSNPSLSAPFATEKQSLLQDSLQRRELEQKLLKLHVDKEQTEAKLIKVEQSGLKTMSARNEKSFLESHLRDVTLGISRLKLTLR